MTKYRYVSDLFGEDDAIFDSIEEAEAVFSEIAEAPVKLTCFDHRRGRWGIRYYGFPPTYEFHPDFDRDTWLRHPNWETILVEVDDEACDTLLE